MNRRVYWLISVAVGVVVGAVTYSYLTVNLALAVTNALLSAAGVGLTVRNHLVLKRRYGEAYTDARNWWNTGIGPLIVVAGLFGVSPTLPIPTDLGFALTVLVTVTALVAWNLGVGATLRTDEIERDGEDR